MGAQAPLHGVSRETPLRVHGLDLSYFTGKLEAYLRAKGVPYERIEMDRRGFEACAEATGVRQMPQVECPDGAWLTDSTEILQYLEAHAPGPDLTPPDPVARFMALLLEDVGDETLWRPALYYRWAFDTDATLLSGRIAAEMLRDVPLPRFMRRWFILRRQRQVYMDQDGVTRDTAPAVERLYHDTLAALENALTEQPFLLGERPCAADFGFFGACFRHFFCDPTPARIMRDTAPRTLAWVSRLWALRAGDLDAAAPVTAVPEAARGLLALAADTHVPYCAANARAVAAGDARVVHDDRGATFKTPPSRYRAWAFTQLQNAFAVLSHAEQERVAALLGAPAVDLLHDPALRFSGDRPIPTLPIRPGMVTGVPVWRDWSG